MSAESILQMLLALGLNIQVSGENLVVEYEDDELTDELEQAIRQHKQALLVLVKARATQNVQAGVTPCPVCKAEYQEVKSAAKVPAIIKRCAASAAASCGYLRIDGETLPSGRQHKTEARECLDFTAKTCPECWRDNIVTDAVGQYCVDCRRRIIGVGQFRP